nr:RNA-directed DNA polymerase, eukaryota [Tanacetum cinerariifolium]
MHESQYNTVQNSTLPALQDDLILSVIEQLKTQVVNCIKINQDNKQVNELLTAELERYINQERVLKELKNNDKASTSYEPSLEIKSLKHTLSEHLKEKESLEQKITLLKNDFQKEESRNIDRELALEKQISKHGLFHRLSYLQNKLSGPNIQCKLMNPTFLLEMRLTSSSRSFLLGDGDKTNRFKEDYTARIAKSIYVTNFPDNVGSSELWKACEGYGKVNNVFIPYRRSKAGKRFAFVRFIHVMDLDRLVGNLCTIWIGRYHLHANAARFERANKLVKPSGPSQSNVHGSFASVVRGSPKPNDTAGPLSSSTALVLDDSCVVDRNLSCHAMGRGLWVMLELDNVSAKQKLLEHVRVNSWFQTLHNATNDFDSSERVVWVDIEGIPLNQPGTILDNFKVISKGKVIMVRVKELFTWNSCFLEPTMSDYSSNDEPNHGAKNFNDGVQPNDGVQLSDEESDGDQEVDGVLETHFSDNSPSTSSCFTPANSEAHANEGEFQDVAPGFGPDTVTSPRLDARVMDHSQEVHDSFNGEASSSILHANHNGGSILGALEDMVRIGQSMGYQMEGCMKDMERIIGSHGEEEVHMVAVYAPQQPACKRALWEYLSSLLRQWNNEAIVMGDFNEVWSMDERLGSAFDVYSARHFDRFILSSGLVGVKLEGYSFTCMKTDLRNDLKAIDLNLERGNVSDDIILKHMELKRRLHDINLIEANELAQKSKIKWAIEGDENTKVFHGIINKKRSQLLIRGIFVDGSWCTVEELDRDVSRDEIHRAVWICGANKSPGPDGCTFEFFRKYWSFIGPDLYDAIVQFFKFGMFPRGCNSSFITLIRKVTDAKFVNDFRPISLIGSVYKVITKILPNRLALVISDLVSETQSAFVANRQILDDPFILNEVLNWCKRKRKQALFFKVDFAKAYDSVRWDYLLDILQAFGFRTNWCRWIRGTFTSAMASILVNGSPTSKFPLCCGLKQGDPLAPYLFILIMESLHLSFSHVPKGVLKTLESIRSNFFNEADSSERKIPWVAWDSVLASKEKGGLGVSSFFALNHGSGTRFWFDPWLSDVPLYVRFPRLFALKLDRESVVADKLGASSVSGSFHRDVRDGEVKVKDVRNCIDDLILPSSNVATRWSKSIPIKVNVFTWRARRDRLPTKTNLCRRGVLLDSSLCPICNVELEDIQHVLFQCDVARAVFRRICRWWDLDWQEIRSFLEWDAWFLAIQLPSCLKAVLEGVFCAAWWRIWSLRNMLIFDPSPPSRSGLFDDILSWSFLWCSSRFFIKLPFKKKEAPKELPKVSMVNSCLKKLKFHLASFDMVVKERTADTAITDDTWGFEHTKACFLDDIIPFVKALKESFTSFDQCLIDEVTEVQNVFKQMELAVEQHREEKNKFQNKMEKVLQENDRLLTQALSVKFMNIVVHAKVQSACLNVDVCAHCVTIEFELKKDFIKKECYETLLQKYHTLEKHCISLEVNNQLNKEIFQRNNLSSPESAPSFAELFEINDLKAQAQAKDTVILKLKEKLRSLNGDVNERNVKREVDEVETLNIEVDHKVTKLVAENEHLKQTYKQLLQEKVFVITALKEQLNKLKGKAVLTEAVSLNPIDPELLKVDVVPLVPKLRKNRTARTDYIRHTQEEASTLREIVESILSPLHTSLDYALTPKNKTK